MKKNDIVYIDFDYQDVLEKTCYDKEKIDFSFN